jgi:hypothetical protein
LAVVFEEVALVAVKAAGKYLLMAFHTHPRESVHVGHGRDQDLAIIRERNEPAVKEVVDGRSQ